MVTCVPNNIRQTNFLGADFKVLHLVDCVDCKESHTYFANFACVVKCARLLKIYWNSFLL